METSATPIKRVKVTFLKLGLSAYFLQRYEIEMRKDALFHILLVFLAFFSYFCSDLKL